MRNPARRFTAWLLALIMVLSLAPMDALAGVFTTYQADVVVVDVSTSIQIGEELVASRTSSGDGVVVVTSPDKILPAGEKNVVFRDLSLTKGSYAVPEGTNQRVIGKYDITVYQDDGKTEWQPRPGDIVDVVVTLPEPVQLVYGETLTLVHNPGGENAQNVQATFYTNENNELKGFAFGADGFSVYAIVAEEHPENARLNVAFQSNGQEVASVLVRKSDAAEGSQTLNTLVYDPGAGTLPEGVIFLGWTKDQNYDINSEEFAPMSIEDVRTDIRQTLNAEGGIADMTVRCVNESL